jgi:two-component system NtrC family sensor kinase
MDVLVTKFSEMLVRLKNSYLELQKTQGALIQAEKLASLGTLSAGVAHEINNPISGIKNCANRIIKDPENVEQNVKYTELIKDAASKVETVVNQLLNFSRKQDIYMEPTNVNLAIESAIALTRHKLESNQIEVSPTFDKTCIVFGSANHLEQVFVNLLLNSLDAIQQRKEKEPQHIGKIEIEVSCNARQVNINFNDNGTGIPDAIRDKVFDPFFTSKEVGKGTGLGLSVSISLIKEHQGKLYFNSTEGSGTNFVIELPLHAK